jgi:serine/threonine-protein kinase
VSLPDPFAGRYSKPQLIGAGGFGYVYRAFDLELEREVALKFLKREFAGDAEFRKRFRREAAAASRLAHPNITVIFDRGDFEGEPYLVMEFVEGDLLSRLIERQASLSLGDRLGLVEQLCDGLHYAHEHGVVHRDIKPVNLIVREDRGHRTPRRTLKILDFGVARLVSATHTTTAGFMFSPNYISPERVLGQPGDERSDMFAVGAVAYELLAQRKAFDITATDPFGLLEEVSRKIVQTAHTPLDALQPDIDPQLARAIDRALAKRPEDRFADLSEMGRELREVRERWDASAAGDKTLVLTAGQRDAARAARAAMDAGDPGAAVEAIERVLAQARGAMIPGSLDELRRDAQAQVAAKEDARRREEDARRRQDEEAREQARQREQAAAREAAERRAADVRERLTRLEQEAEAQLRLATEARERHAQLEREARETRQRELEQTRAEAAAREAVERRAAEARLEARPAPAKPAPAKAAPQVAAQAAGADQAAVSSSTTPRSAASVPEPALPLFSSTAESGHQAYAERLFWAAALILATVIFLLLFSAVLQWGFAWSVQ